MADISLRVAVQEACGSTGGRSWDRHTTPRVVLRLWLLSTCSSPTTI